MMITLNRHERMTLAVTAAVLLTLPAVSPLYSDADWVPRLVGAVLVVGVVNFLGRLLRVPLVLQPVLGLLALLIYVAAVFAGSTLTVFVPTAETFTRLGDLLSGGSDDISTLVTPVPTNDGLLLLGVLAVGGITVLADALAVVAGRAAIAGLPLLLLFAAPSAIGDVSVGWLAFAGAGTGWLLMLMADGTERVHHWGVALSTPGHRAKPGGGLGYAGSRIGVAALGFAIVLPVLLPDVGNGSGDRGDGGPRTITTYNPLTTLRGDLRLPKKKTILTYTTDDPTPDYLRMTTLQIYDGNGWRQDKLDGNLRKDGVEGRDLPTPEGAGDAAFSEVSATIDIDTLEARWLPAPATPSEVTVNGPWLWDATSSSIFSTRAKTNDTEPYTVLAHKIDPEAKDLQAASSALPADIVPFAANPHVTPKVASITAQVVAGKKTPFAKAKALQDYFRSDRFAYSLETLSGSSPDALEDFLDNRRGFCEQFASAMAAMLRQAGVPARVAVGFTPGTKRADGSRIVTTDDAHAWPEAWIDGAGWVRFEPTPTQGFAPAYTKGPSTAPTPTVSSSPRASASTSAAPAPGAADPKRPDPTSNPAAAAPGDGGRSFPTGIVLSLLAVVAVLSIPGLVHVARRRSRWMQPGAGVAWAQLRDDSFDVGLPLDPSRSPRQVLAGLSEQAGLAGADREALGRIALAVERDRYAPAGSQSDGGHLQHDVTTVRRALRAPLPRRRRLRLLALPPSTLRWARTGISDALRGAVEGVAQVSAGISDKLRRS